MDFIYLFIFTDMKQHKFFVNLYLMGVREWRRGCLMQLWKYVVGCKHEIFDFKALHECKTNACWRTDTLETTGELNWELIISYLNMNGYEVLMMIVEAEGCIVNKFDW